MKYFMKWPLVIIASVMLAMPARADLTAVVTPGYQFPIDGSVAPSYDLLNLLANPTVQIYGTVGGSNTLAVGSVTGTQLSSSVADGDTIGFNGNSPPGLQVLAAGIIGNGLQADTTTNLSVFADTNYFKFDTNSIANTNTVVSRNWLTFKAESLTDTNISPTAAIQPSKLGLSTNGIAVSDTNGVAKLASLGNHFELVQETNSVSGTNLVPTLSLKYFSSPETNYSGTMAAEFSHKFSHVPSNERWVMVCKTAEGGYSVGDEVNVDQLAVADGNNKPGAFTWGANSTNVFFSVNSSGLQLNTKTASGVFGPSLGDWAFKCYAWP